MDRERKKETDSEGERATDKYFHSGKDSIVLISEA